jgi:hypothetical protein
MTRTHKKGDIVNSLFWGTLILLIGVTLLGVNTGYLSSDVWVNVWRLWPVLLIVWGLNIILRNTSLQFISYLSPVILILAFTYAATWAPVEDERGGWHLPKYIGLSEPASRTMTEYTHDYERTEDVHALDVEFDLGAASLDVISSSEEAFIGVEIKSNTGEPTVNFEMDGNTLEMYAASPSRTSIWSNCKEEWTVQLPAGVPLSLNLDAGASACDLNLEDMLLSHLDIDAGAVAIYASLPAPDVEGYTVNIDLGASDLDLTFPENTPVRIEFDGGLSATNFKKAGFKKADGYWCSEAYEPGVPFADLSITSGVASIDVAFN